MKTKYTDGFKAKLVDGFLQSGLTLTDFAKSKDISPSTLKRWVEAREREETLFLIPHIPKTGGTSLLYHFRMNFGDDRVISYGPNSRVERFFRNFSQLEEMNDDELAGIKTVQGHGVSENLFPYFKNRNTKIIIVLRHPVSHIRSRFHHYSTTLASRGLKVTTNSFLKSTPKNFLAATLIEKFPEFISDGAESQLEKATSILSKFDYVFTTENLDKQTPRFLKAYKLPKMDERRRVSSKKLELDLSDEQIIEDNPIDIALFEAINKVLDTTDSHNGLTFDKAGKEAAIKKLASRRIRERQTTLDVYHHLAKSLCTSLRAEAAIAKTSLLDDVKLKRPKLFREILQETENENRVKMNPDQVKISNSQLISFLKNDRIKLRNKIIELQGSMICEPIDNSTIEAAKPKVNKANNLTENKLPKPKVKKAIKIVKSK